MSYVERNLKNISDDWEREHLQDCIEEALKRRRNKNEIKAAEDVIDDAYKTHISDVNTDTEVPEPSNFEEVTTTRPVKNNWFDNGFL